MKQKLKTYLYWILAVVPFAVSAAFYSRLPEQVAVHWDIEGHANGYASRTFAAFGLPAVLLGIVILVNVQMRVDPKWKNIDRSPQMKQISRWGVLILMDVAECATVAQGIGARFDVSVWIPLLTGILLIVIGNYLPKCKYNYTMGIRLPWTLASEENWRKTHRFAGTFWILGGALIALTAFFHWKWVELASLTLMIALPAIYSFLLYRKETGLGK